MPTQHGRPSYNITYEQLAFLRNLGMSWMGIAKTLGIARSTLYLKKAQYNFDIIEPYISNDALMQLIREIINETPNAGEIYILGSLRARKVRVARWRVRECINILDPLGRALRRRNTIQRRKYRVKGANYLW